jgi:hypothetical protein
VTRLAAIPVDVTKSVYHEVIRYGGARAAQTEVRSNFSMHVIGIGEVNQEEKNPMATSISKAD